MEVTDGKIAGLTFNAKEGSALEFASLGAEHVDSEMGGQAVAQTLCVGCDQQATLTDEACGNAAADQTNMKITGGVFGFDALASANLIFDDGCLEDEQQAVGMSVSSLANGVADTSCPDCEIPDLTEIEVSGDFTKTMTTVITDIDN